MIIYFKDKNNKSQKRYKTYNILNTGLESVESIKFIGPTSASITLSNMVIGSIVLPISAGTVCNLSLGNKILYEMIMSKYKKYKKQHEKDQQTINFFDNFYRRSSRDTVIDKNENESLYNFSYQICYWNTKWIFFMNLNIKVKLIFLVKIN